MSEHAVSFDRRHLVTPVIYHGKTRRKLSTTRHTGGHHDEVLVTISVDGDEYTLELSLNRGLLPEGHVISYRDADKSVLHRPNDKELELCQYTGHVRGKQDSWVAISTCYGLRGVIHDGTTIRYIEPVKENDIQSLHRVYEDNNVKNRHCGYDAQNSDKAYDTFIASSDNNMRHKRAGSFPKRGFFNANEESRYIEVVLVADHAQYLGADRNLKLLHHQLQETINIANAIFSPQNIFIALTGVEVWTAEDRIVLDPDTQTTLQRFCDYTILLNTIGSHDHAQLVTQTDFYKGHAGLAYVESMCSAESCSIIYRSAHNVTASTIVKTAYSMLHELGHSFGMRHDGDNCTCADKFCVMNKKEQRVIPTRWSDCSLEVLSANYADGNYSSCLRNKPVHLFGPPSCGNGFLDLGEECDCGVSLDEDKSSCHKCCDPATCLLRAKATCVGGVCCDVQNCQFQPAGTVCRPAELECDLPEYCSGLSDSCPEDVFKMDAVPCFGEMCARQRCVSAHDQQRQILRHRSKDCLANCSGHGVCNSKGFCHCDDGFAPPLCDVPGFGGSVDSGPTRPSESPNCSCDHDISPTYAGALYDSKPTTVHYNIKDRDLYITALGSITVIMAIIVLICLLKSRFQKDKSKSSLHGKYSPICSRRSSFRSANKEEENDEAKIEITPAILSSIHLKKLRREEYMNKNDKQDKRSVNTVEAMTTPKQKDNKHITAEPIDQGIGYKGAPKICE
ncbi:disintegrin and metalloproteinase domain-containing protein 32-like isoform X2 [Plodia interpunctella]|uniref:disintegrin and metalloproteinase domain-containing protein 32-like isoform X2 n=1 Tax=Plodia interpunctella TaxID=58824 RepID=UPI002367F249|nr:disintegrin and metalloproteinase domain-containing protein 32-like isoform X2 [Plodia interpunctella]